MKIDFRTPVDIPATDISMDHSTGVMLFGSCFSENIGLKLTRFKFQVDVNPFGILYNPISVSRAIRRILSADSFSESDLLYNNELYHSLMHHGHFSATDKQTCLQNISLRFEKAVASIHQTDIFLITFGSAFVYQFKESGEIAGNCHKMPADRFNRFRLSVEQIVEEWTEVIYLLTVMNPSTKLLFTVSPVRHWKEGAHENQISKSTLHLAIDALQKQFEQYVGYFPAYEVMMDELRDYRFYDEDMVHPNSLATEYIWDLFSDTYFSEETGMINKEWAPIRRALEHRPLHPGTEAYRHFLAATAQKLETFAVRHPEITCEEERHLLSALNNLT
jgi:hypothetical protein